MNIFKLIKLFQKAKGRSPSPGELANLKKQAEAMQPGNVVPFQYKRNFGDEVDELIEKGDVTIGTAPKTTKKKAPVDPKFEAAVKAQDERSESFSAFKKRMEARNKEAAFNIAFKRYKDIDKKPLEIDEVISIYTNLGKYPKGRSIIIDDIYDIRRGYMLPGIGNRSREMIANKLDDIVKAKKQPNPFKKPTEEVEGQLEMDFTDWDPKGMAGGGLAYMLGEQPRVGMMYGGDPGFAFEYGGSWADWNDNHKHMMPVTEYIGTKLPKDRLPFRQELSGGSSAGLPAIEIGPIKINPRASGSYSSNQPYGPNYKEKTLSNTIGFDAEIDLPGNFKLKGDYGKYRTKDRLYDADGNFIDKRVRDDHDYYNVGLEWSKQFADGGRIGMSGGGGLFKLIKSLLKKKKSPSEEFADYLKEMREKSDRINREFYKGLEEGGELDQNIDKIKEGYKFPKVGKEFRKKLKERMDKRRLLDFETEGRKPNAIGGRIGFKNGGFDKGRRNFLKLAAGLASIPFVGKYFKFAKPAAKVAKAVEASNATGMPAWFPKLVDKVMKEGTDLGGTVERQIVKQVELPGSKTKITVEHDLTTGDTIVDIGAGKHGFEGGRYGQPTRLELKKGEWIEPDMDLVTGKLKTPRKKKPVKTKDEFWVEEAEFTGGHPENIKYEETVSERYGNHASDFSEVEKYATGKNVDEFNLKGTKKREADDFAQGRAEMQWAEEADDFAKGGLARMLGE